MCPLNFGFHPILETFDFETIAPISGANIEKAIKAIGELISSSVNQMDN